MKKTPPIIVAALFILSICSCEDVIDVALPTEAPRLIIDAVVRVDTTQNQTLVSVKVRETSSFFENLPPANLQQITMSNLDNPGSGTDTGVLIETGPGSGIYERSFATQQLVDDRWFLQVDFEDKFYVAFAEFTPTVPIDTIQQGDGTIFGEDDTELVITYTDPENRDDYYLFDFDFGNFLVSDDEFYQGQSFSFSYFYDDKLNPGDQATISILGVDGPFFNYADKIIQQSE
ncbi:MAG: DUF4249 family protein, partial [Marinirhabdus sp.]